MRTSGFGLAGACAAVALVLHALGTRTWAAQTDTYHIESMQNLDALSLTPTQRTDAERFFTRAEESVEDCFFGTTTVRAQVDQTGRLSMDSSSTGWLCGAGELSLDPPTSAGVNWDKNRLAISADAFKLTSDTKSLTSSLPSASIGAKANLEAEVYKGITSNLVVEPGGRASQLTLSSKAGQVGLGVSAELSASELSAGLSAGAEASLLKSSVSGSETFVVPDPTNGGGTQFEVTTTGNFDGYLGGVAAGASLNTKGEIGGKLAAGIGGGFSTELERIEHEIADPGTYAPARERQAETDPGEIRAALDAMDAASESAGGGATRHAGLPYLPRDPFAFADPVTAETAAPADGPSDLFGPLNEVTETSRPKDPKADPPQPPSQPAPAQPAPPPEPPAQQFHPVTVSRRDIVIRLYDDGSYIDGDTVTVRLNNRAVVSRYEMKAPPGETFRISLAGGINSLEIYAHNEGEVSPNTAMVQISDVIDGPPTQEWSLELGQSQRMQLIAPQGP